MSLSISGHTLVMESPKLGPRDKAFESFSSLNALTLGPNLGDSITKAWPEIERLSDIFAVTPFILFHVRPPVFFHVHVEVELTYAYLVLRILSHPVDVYVCDARNARGNYPAV